MELQRIGYIYNWFCSTLGGHETYAFEEVLPASRTATIQKEICGIRQHFGETLHKYWERFNKLCATCPHHQISEQTEDDGPNMIDVASGGALMYKTPTATRHLISNMASNMQQFGTRGAVTSRVVNKVGTIDNRVCTSVAFVPRWSTQQICTPTLQKTKSDNAECVGAIGGYQYEAAVSVESESRAAYDLEIWIHPKHVGSKPEQLLAAGSIILSTTISTITTTTSSTTGQFTFNGRVDEVDECE
ncbi:hypothetical protein CR513_23173, partial [Mucuna pruriens]